jgi:hypothetical protein
MAINLDESYQCESCEEKFNHDEICEHSKAGKKPIWCIKCCDIEIKAMSHYFEIPESILRDKLKVGYRIDCPDGRCYEDHNWLK